MQRIFNILYVSSLIKLPHHGRQLNVILVRPIWYSMKGKCQSKNSLEWLCRLVSHSLLAGTLNDSKCSYSSSNIHSFIDHEWCRRNKWKTSAGEREKVNKLALQRAESGIKTSFIFFSFPFIKTSLAFLYFQCRFSLLNSRELKILLLLSLTSPRDFKIKNLPHRIHA